MSSLDMLLEELQLDCESAGPAFILPPSPGHVAQARALSDILMSFQDMIQDHTGWRSIDARGAREAGWKVSEYVDGVRRLALSVGLVSGAALSIMVPSGQDADLLGSVDLVPQGQALVRLVPGTPVVLRADDKLLGVRLDEDGHLEVAPYRVTAERAFTPLPESPTDRMDPVDASDWLHAEAPDWLKGALDEQLAIGGIFHAAVAAGLVLRLDRPGVTRRGPSGGLAALLAAAKPPAGAARGWIDGLDASQLDALEAFATAEAGRLWERLEPVAERTAPGDPTWRDAFTELLRSRDDLSSAYAVLDARERGAATGTALAAFDRMARAEIEAMPVRGLVTDPRLEAAVSADADAWWGLPART